MFSPLKLCIDYDLSDYVNGASMNTITKEMLPCTNDIFIPTLMQGISKATKRTTTVSTNGLSVFKNTDGRPSVTSSIIKEKNYITSYNKINYTINKGTTVRCCFLNGKLSKLSFNKGD